MKEYWAFKRFISGKKFTYLSNDGKLLLNANKKFTCKKVKCRIKYKVDATYCTYDTELYIANSYGQYEIDDYDYENQLDNCEHKFQKKFLGIF